jgi:transglutaminase-like putative cysteine protease
MVEKNSEFLQETKYCDYSHPLIQSTANKLLRSDLSEEEQARTLFNYVRDNVLYQFGKWGKKASTVLKEGKGMCTNSANLLVALLRADQIPAGYGIMRVSGPEYFGKLMLPLFKELVSPQSVHVYAYAFLNGKWVKVDPSFDPQFSHQVSKLDPAFNLIDWKGDKDEVMPIAREMIYSDIGPLANIDQQLDKKPRHAKGLPLTIGNLYLRFLREQGSKIHRSDELEENFLSWLRRKYPPYYFLLITSLKRKERKAHELYKG